MGIEEEIVEYQKREKQLQAVSLQRYQMEVQLKEMENALSEIEKTEGDEIFKAVGPILVKTTKDDAKKELNEKIEFYKMKIKSLKEEEGRLAEGLKRLGKKLEDELKNVQRPN